MSGLEARITTTYYALQVQLCSDWRCVSCFLALSHRPPPDEMPLALCSSTWRGVGTSQGPCIRVSFWTGKLFWEKNVDQTPLENPSKSPTADRAIHDIINDDPY